MIWLTTSANLSKLFHPFEQKKQCIIENVYSCFPFNVNDLQRTLTLKWFMWRENEA